MLFTFISFFAGVLTVLAPCILPLLPIIVGGSLDASNPQVQRKKFFTIALSLVVSIVAFTLLLKVSTAFIDIPSQTWKWISGGILVGMGVLMLVPKLWESRWMARLQAKGNKVIGSATIKNNTKGDILIGAVLGPVFTTCSPTYTIILATVLPQNFVTGLWYLTVYAFGLALALGFIAFLGQRFMSTFNIIAKPNGWFKTVLAIIFVAVGIAVITGFDKVIESKILDTGFFDVTKVEEIILESIGK